MTISAPSKLTVPFANAGSKNTIPVASQIGITNGAASYTDGFPPLTMTAKSAGGVPPYGQDMNGVLYAITQGLQYIQAGGVYTYDSSFASSVGGYPIGAVVNSSDNSGSWISTTANNTTNPESFGAGWYPYAHYGAASVTMTSSNVTLTALQAAKKEIIITGALTANLQLIFPVWNQEWIVLNNTTGSFSITAKTASGSGVVLTAGVNDVYGDGTNIKQVSIPLGFTPVQQGGGTGQLSNKVYIGYDGTSNLNLQIDTANYASTWPIYSAYALGQGQTWTSYTVSGGTPQRQFGTTYTNSTGKPIFVIAYYTASYNGYISMSVGGVVVCNTSAGSYSNSFYLPVFAVVPNGATYVVNTSLGTGTLSNWAELR